jgi:hypothetical protein
MSRGALEDLLFSYARLMEKNVVTVFVLDDGGSTEIEPVRDELLHFSRTVLKVKYSSSHRSYSCSTVGMSVKYFYTVSDNKIGKQIISFNKKRHNCDNTYSCNLHFKSCRWKRLL